MSFVCDKGQIFGNNINKSKYIHEEITGTLNSGNISYDSVKEVSILSFVTLKISNLQKY